VARRAVQTAFSFYGAAAPIVLAPLIYGDEQQKMNEARATATDGCSVKCSRTLHHASTCTSV